MAQIGAILLERKAITEEQLIHALLQKKKSGSRLGDVLVGEGIIGYLSLYQALADHHGLTFVDLLKQPPDASLIDPTQAESYLKFRAIPWRRNDGVIVVALCELAGDTLEWIKTQYGDNPGIVFTSPVDIRRSVESFCRAALESDSRLKLWQERPQYSARTSLLHPQRQALYGFTLLALLAIIIFPVYSALAIIISCHLAYSATMLFKCIIFARGTDAPTQQNWQQKLASLDEHTLPIYTVLVPMYREAESLPGLLQAMHDLDYPASKLDIKLVLEADDQETLQVAYALRPRYQFDIIRVPPSEPRTKPKACNYALRFAYGEMITIFDADDRPERSQLKKAVYALRNLPEDIICLQARLNYYNANDNLLTRFFSLEYTILFHFMLYVLESIGIPIPLGGTSNHISLSRLKELGAWDPYNVTEDADLGTRLAARGFRTAMLDSYTMEEAPVHVMPWIRQRSRWIKGYMQTWLVHMRKPAQLYRTLGVKGFGGFQFFIGISCFTFLTAPLVWVLSILWLGSIAQWHEVAFPTWLAVLTAVNLALNILTHWYLSLYSAILYRKYTVSMIIAALLYPFYLVLHSIASYRALWQLIVKPHFWEKTMHGLAGKTDQQGMESDVVRIR